MSLPFPLPRPTLCNNHIGMPLYQHPEIEKLAIATDTQILTWHIAETEDELIKLLPDGVRYAAESRLRFGSGKRCKEWLSARILKSLALGNHAEIAYTPEGKPFLSDIPNTFISISHTQSYVCLAIGKKNIGIDIEKYGHSALRLHDRFLRKQEKVFLGDENRERQAVLLWSAKEAIYKHATPSCLASLMDIRITSIPPAPTAPLVAETEVGRPASHVHYRFLPDFVMTLCIG